MLARDAATEAHQIQVAMGLLKNVSDDAGWGIRTLFGKDIPQNDRTESHAPPCRGLW
jgi:hypothetical protein